MKTLGITLFSTIKEALDSKKAVAAIAGLAAVMPFLNQWGRALTAMVVLSVYILAQAYVDAKRSPRENED